jgi:hypothetical protein
MNHQDSDLDQSISRNLRMLIRGLTQNNTSETYEGYKALFQVGEPAIEQIREAILKSNWRKIKYPNEIRYVSGLVNVIHDIDESEARRITNQLKNNGCDLVVARILDSVCKFTQADYTQYNVCGVKIFEHRKLVTKGDVKSKLEQWLKTAPAKDLKEIERIYILRREDLESLGNYTPILFQINLVWDNPYSRWNPASWYYNFVIESTLYHEIGHHVHRHTFGQDADQEKEADKYSGRLMANSNHVLFRLARLLRGRLTTQ